MSTYLRTIVLALVIMLIAGAARANEEEFRDRQHSPGAAIGAAFINVVFMPVRLVITAIGAGLGGFTGFMTAGDRTAADDVWWVFGGDQIITPDMLRGQRPYRFTAYDPAAVAY